MFVCYIFAMKLTIFITVFLSVAGNKARPDLFQAYLLEGIHRWNEDRECQATANQVGSTYSSFQVHGHNTLSQAVYGRPLYPQFTLPRVYTGEIIFLFLRALDCLTKMKCADFILHCSYAR